MQKASALSLALSSRDRANDVDYIVFVHYTAIRSVQGGPRSFKSLLEVRNLFPLSPHSLQRADCQDIFLLREKR